MGINVSLRHSYGTFQLRYTLSATALEMLFVILPHLVAIKIFDRHITDVHFVSLPH